MDAQPLTTTLAAERTTIKRGNAITTSILRTKCLSDLEMCDGSVKMQPSIWCSSKCDFFGAFDGPVLDESTDNIYIVYAK